MLERTVSAEGAVVKEMSELLTAAEDMVTVKRVYGEPFQSNGVTLIPAAAVRGGVGGGEGEETESTPAGRGGGFGMSARPVGAYKIEGDEVVWVPAPDVTRLVVSAQIVAIVALLVIRSVLKRRRTSA